MKIAIAVLVLLGAFSVVASTERFDAFSKECGLSPNSKSRIFAAADGEHWKEYQGVDRIPEGNSDWSEGAFVLRNGQVVAAEVDGVGEDFSDSSFYCFDLHGKLTQIERDFTTAWGWGYSETDSFKDGAVSAHQEHFFDTKTRAQIYRPAGYDDVHDAMKLKVYKSIKELPFFKLM
jgi:hypothetical protein